MKSFLNKRLNRQLLIPLVVICVVVVSLGILLGFYAYYLQEDYREKQSHLSEKQEIALNISDHAYQVLIRARGYYAFALPEEREALFDEYAQLQLNIEEFSRLDLSEEEASMIEEVHAISSRYYDDFLPIAMNLVESGTMEELQQYATSGGNETVNELIAMTNAYVDANNAETNRQAEAYSNSVSNLLMICLMFILLIMALLFSLFAVLFARITKPIKQLTAVSEELATSTDQGVELPITKREDEIGILSRSFGKMVVAIQEKEEELTAQNEELISQQDELEQNQRKLLDSLDETEKIKERLLKFNQLNRSISTTVKKQVLLDELIHHLDEIYQADKMIFTLTTDFCYSAKGLEQETIKTFIQTLNQGILPILTAKKEPYIVSRQATTAEKGIAETSVIAFDLYVPVYTSNDKIIAVFGSTRMGQSYKKEEIDEMIGAMNQIALAIEKTVLYEETEKNRQLNQDIIDHVNEAIQFIDYEGRLIHYNEAFVGIIKHLNSIGKQVPFNEWVQWMAQSVKESSQLESFFNYVNTNREPASTRYETVTADGRVFEVYAQPILRRKAFVGTILVHRDMTKEYEIDQMKSELISTVSHELRTPLTSVLGFTELMLNRDLKPDRQKRYLESIHGEAKRLTNLINNFLDLQRMENGDFYEEKTAISLHPLMKQVIEQFVPHYQSHHFHWRFDVDDDRIMGSEEKIQQLLMNLISNAVKFSPNGGDIIVRTKQEEDHVIIDVMDEGLGIPEQDRPNLFRKFFRVDNSDRRSIGGTGLGLPICKEIAEFHGGTIFLKSSSEAGTVFRIRLPLVKPNSTIQDELDREETQHAILLLEDDQALALLLVDELKAEGFSVKHVTTIQAGIDYVKAKNVDAFIVDLMLEDGDAGWKFIKQVKALEKTKQKPIFISSALNEVKEKTEAYDVNYYLTKPYPVKTLIKQIHDVLDEADGKGSIVFPQ
ncbi:ATP-binding protein [Shouchella hunanensis]|uniref:histidine kinase n=1 Tax=Shouchella hunanensis TaxID=766894 RepID=A0ABY7W2B3_9BACI|nr:ATP-binding protein [Shouchella hunanensis]WDF02080.1 ATP-binding protein [Shouchella hunanensis]